MSSEFGAGRKRADPLIPLKIKDMRESGTKRTGLGIGAYGTWRPAEGTSVESSRQAAYDAMVLLINNRRIYP